LIDLSTLFALSLFQRSITCLLYNFKPGEGCITVIEHVKNQLEEYEVVLQLGYPTILNSYILDKNKLRV